MCPVSTVREREPGHIEHTEVQPHNTGIHNWHSIVPFAQAFPDFQLHTIQYFISITPTGRPLLAIIKYTLEVSNNYVTMSLSIETGRHSISLSTGTRL